MDDRVAPLPAWFARVGRPLAAAEDAAIRAMIDARGAFLQAEVGGVGHWHEAAEFIREADRDGTGWDQEEEERARLWDCAAERCAEDELLARLDALTRALTGPLHRAAAAAAARDGVADPALVRAAAGAALMAALQHALVELAGGGAAHFFVAKYALFAGGRWPLGWLRGRYLVF